ncbi:MAG TPA: hypothetical protein VLG44_03870 [Chlamydiales bacterium]|nr:hypothetical protein [Chlamydiales bacterium]
MTESITMFHLTVADYQEHIKWLNEELKKHPENAFEIQEVIQRDELMIHMLEHPEEKAADVAKLKSLCTELQYLEKHGHGKINRYLGVFPRV